MLSWENPNRAIPALLHKCCSPKIRNIFGHGHTWVFRSAVERLTLKPKEKTKIKTTRNIQLEHDAKYIKMILNPARNVISYPTIDFITYKVPKLRYNCTERPMKRSKLRNNKKVAFMSGCPRFPINKLQQLLAMTTTSPQKCKKIEIYAVPKETIHINPINLMEPHDRLQILPNRYVLAKPLVDKTDKMRNTFEALPPARILIQDTTLLRRLGSVDKIHGKFRVEHYFKQEYRAIAETCH